MKTLVVGYGNVLRRDDGAGVQAVRRLAEKGLPRVEARVVHQLSPELAEEVCGYGEAVFVDASSGGPEVSFRKVERAGSSAAASSHHFSPEALMRLSEAVYGRSPALYLCTIRGERFGLGEGLTPEVRRRVGRALRVLTEFLTKEGGHARGRLHAADR
jgi:hydrogenase maturation protease